LGGHHVPEFRLVGGGHDHEARKATEIGKVERAGMSRPVGAHQASAVESEPHRQALDCHVVHHLVVGTLQERRINRCKGFHAFAGEASSEGHGMLLGNTDIESSRGKLLGEPIKTGAVRHRRRDGDDLVVLFCLGDQAIRKDSRVGRRFCRCLHLCARHHIELAHAVIFVARGLGRRIALALLRNHMHENRSFRGIAHIAQHGQKLTEIVPVDRANIVKAQFLEPGSALPHVARVFLEPRQAALPSRG
jgi:hypothetical protein